MFKLISGTLFFNHSRLSGKSKLYKNDISTSLTASSGTFTMTSFSSCLSKSQYIGTLIFILKPCRNLSLCPHDKGFIVLVIQTVLFNSREAVEPIYLTATHIVRDSNSEVCQAALRCNGVLQVVLAPLDEG